MQQIGATTFIAKISQFLVYCAGITAAGLGLQGGVSNGPACGKQLELTQVDVFATRTWKADDINVLGFHLGMKRADAIENARSRGVILIASNRGNTDPCAASACAVCDDQNILCDGIEVHFGKDDRIGLISVMKPLAEAEVDLRKFSVTQKFKGRTYQLFHNYSNGLRLKLLGRESRREEDSSRRTTKYFYPAMGVELDVSHSHNKRIPENEADLTISFTHADTPDVQSSPTRP